MWAWSNPNISVQRMIFESWAHSSTVALMFKSRRFRRDLNADHVGATKQVLEIRNATITTDATAAVTEPMTTAIPVKFSEYIGQINTKKSFFLWSLSSPEGRAQHQLHLLLLQLVWTGTGTHYKSEIEVHKSSHRKYYTNRTAIMFPTAWNEVENRLWKHRAAELWYECVWILSC